MILLSDLQQSDVEFSVPAQYLPVIEIYLNFIKQASSNNSERKDIHSDNLIIIDDIDNLLLCFLMQSFFDDDIFLVHLMEQAYNVWDEFHPRIPTLSNDRTVYLYSPCEFVPNSYMDSDTFFREWLNINVNKIVVLKGEDRYHTDVTYYPNGQIGRLEAYRTLNGKYRYSSCERVWYTNGQLHRRQNYKDGLIDGLSEAWYKDGKLQYRGNYKRGNYDGLREAWYENGRLEYWANYKDDVKDGLQQAWYEATIVHASLSMFENISLGMSLSMSLGVSEDMLKDTPKDANPSLPSGLGRERGQLRYQWNYKDGNYHGLHQGWYEDGRPRYRYNYKDGNYHGLQEAWYKDGQLECRWNYKDGEQMTLWKIISQAWTDWVGWISRGV